MDFNNIYHSVEKTILVISVILRVVLLLEIIIALFYGDLAVVFYASLTFVLTFTPAIIERNFRIGLPPEFEFIIIIFIFAAIFMGHIWDYYNTFWWWDVMLHSGSGFILGFVGFMMLYILYDNDKINASPFTIMLFSFCFAVALATVWEIFEFFMDETFGFNMQKSGLQDTMWDLVVATMGSLIISAAGYVYLKKVEIPLFEWIILKFKDENPTLFKRKKDN